MLKEIRKLKTHKKRNYIYTLMWRGHINKYTNAKGYVCYDTDELTAYRKQSKMGRPPKGE